jgi:hypothetical protein
LLANVHTLLSESDGEGGGDGACAGEGEDGACAGEGEDGACAGEGEDGAGGDGDGAVSTLLASKKMD